MQPKRLSRYELLSYGLPGIAINLVVVLFTIYLPKFYVDVVGVNLRMVGLLILVARFVNALTDPIVGICSDHTQSAWGRRRPWIFVASMVLALAFLLINMPPVSLSKPGAMVWLGVCLVVMLVAMSSLEMPYYALGAQLSCDYQERTLLLGVRAAMQNFGILIAPTLFIAITYFLGSANAVATREKYAWFGSIGFLIILSTCWYCVYYIREPMLKEAQKPHPGFFKHFSVLKDNKPYRLLVLITALQFMGVACTTSLFLFFVEHVLKSTAGDYIILIYTVSVVLGIPIWIYISRHIDKRNAMVTALLLNFFVLVNMLQIGTGDVNWYCVLVAFYGLTGGAVSFVLAPSMIADVIDFDEWRNGQRREGVHMGTLFFVGKIAMGLGVILVFWILDALGYVAGKAQSEQVIQGIRIMFIGLPSFLGAIEVILFLFYPINKEMHKKIRAEIEAR